jgi:hypothetical protein
VKKVLRASVRRRARTGGSGFLSVGGERHPAGCRIGDTSYHGAEESLDRRGRCQGGPILGDHLPMTRVSEQVGTGAIALERREAAPRGVVEERSNGHLDRCAFHQCDAGRLGRRLVANHPKKRFARSRKRSPRCPQQRSVVRFPPGRRANPSGRFGSRRRRLEIETNSGRRAQSPETTGAARDRSTWTCS